MADNTLLMVVMDCSSAWALEGGDKGAKDWESAVAALCAFFRAFLLSRQRNRSALFGCSDDAKCALLIGEPLDDATRLHAMHFASEASKLLNAYVAENTSQTAMCDMVCGFSRALCYQNRIRTGGQSLKSRILFIQRSFDAPMRYVQMMNCIFAAQSEGIIVDVIVLRDRDSSYLQQACNLTGGVYFRDSSVSSLASNLLTQFLVADSELRKSFSVLTQAPVAVDARASCFCHKKPLDAGYVCSVCLSVFCSFVPVCSTCQSKFQFPAMRLATGPLDTSVL